MRSCSGITFFISCSTSGTPCTSSSCSSSASLCASRSRSYTSQIGMGLIRVSDTISFVERVAHPPWLDRSWLNGDIWLVFTRLPEIPNSALQSGKMALKSSSRSSPTSDNVASTRDDDDLAVLALRVVGMTALTCWMNDGVDEAWVILIHRDIVVASNMPETLSERSLG
ncbi:hypothetical protein EDB89DRAFT_514188 [Lactarius sanguifluus]|nr:hypothetical protein EDB89DRAFT_514188 [Lactarius sanguifluus]